MWRFLAFALFIVVGVKSGMDYLASDRFQVYADRTKAPWTCRMDFVAGQYLTIMSRYDQSAKVFKRISARCPGTEIGERSDFEYAHSLETGGKRAEAIDAYGKFLEKYPGSRRAKLAHRSVDILKTS